MHALKLACRTDEKDWVLADLWSRDTEGITEIEQPDGTWMLEAFFAEPFDAKEFRAFGAAWQQHGDEDWAESWKRTWEPMEVGRTWFLVPDWRDDPAPPGRHRLVVHARQASGSGYQAPTQLALEAIEDFVNPKERFLDWGTGSGILSAAASLLGAGSIVACDVDEAAAIEASANFAAREIPALLFTGSGRSLRPRIFDVVAANMNAVAIIESHEEIARVTRPGGRLILSGFKSRRMDAVRKSFAGLGFQVLRKYQKDDWRCLVMS